MKFLILGSLFISLKLLILGSLSISTKFLIIGSFMLDGELTVKTMPDCLYDSPLLNFLLWVAWLCYLLLLWSKLFKVKLFRLLRGMRKSPGANCKGYFSSLSAVSSWLSALCTIVFLLLFLGDLLFYLTISFLEMLMFQSKLSSMSSIFIIIFLCNTLNLLLHSPACLTLYTIPSSPILETIIWTFSSKKSVILSVPRHWDIFLTSTRSPGWRLNENLQDLFLCCKSLFSGCFDTTL